MKRIQIRKMKNKTSKTVEILKYIERNKNATKYEIAVNVLGQKGSKQELRGYYCKRFETLRKGGILEYNSKNYKYSLTEYGKCELLKAIL